MNRILAVIPARAGSKGIPNKNIRLINGKPLVAYAIDNALSSKYITDVVVTTDSAMVRVIAEQMGAQVIDRSAELCGDAVTLDGVIYDAARRFDCEVVVTMQPTSPTLRVTTLDKAIEAFLDRELDTLISANNRPHLAWTRNAAGTLVPAYEERLNRQYLPPYYAETGAFVIARRAVVTPETRIGENVEVFDIPDEEALDIDSYADLATAAMTLERKKIAFYVNGNNKRGLGHVYRALELADEFYSKPDIYFDSNQTNRAVFGETTHNLIPVNGIGELLGILQRERYALFVNDILDTSLDYMIAVRTALPHAKIVNFEDSGEGASRADLVFNALFSEEDAANIRAGEQYYIASKLFMFYHPKPIREKVEDVFISFGGADPQNYSDRLMAIVGKSKYRDVRFHVVLGRAKTNVSDLLRLGSALPNVEVLHDIVDMPRVMHQCDVGVTSRGRTGYELALLGIPSIAMAQNKREERHGFVCAENGFTYLGLNPTDALIESTLDAYIGMTVEERTRYRELLLAHDLRNGRQRVINLINSL